MKSSAATKVLKGIKEKKVSEKKNPVNNKPPIKVFPQGIAVTGDDLSSFVLFKDLEGKISFPVWCPILPFGIMPMEGEMSLKNPYDLAHEILNQLNYKLKLCTFDTVESDEQLATLSLETTLKDTVQLIKVKAFEALAICSSKKDIEFYATQSFIQKTRDVAVFEKNSPSQLLKKNSFLKSRQKYMM